MKVTNLKKISFLFFMITSMRVWSSNDDIIQMTAVRRLVDLSFSVDNIKPNTEWFEHSLKKLRPKPTASNTVYGQVITNFRKKLANGNVFEMSVRGFGVLIGPRHVLTTANKLFLPGFDRPTTTGDQWFEMNKWAWSAVFIPQDDTGKLSRTLQVKAHMLICPQKWIDKTDSAMNYGLLILNKDIGQNQGWAGLKSVTDQELKNQRILVTGIKHAIYPAIGDQIWEREYKIEKVVDDSLFYKVPLVEKAIGSALAVSKKKQASHSIIGLRVAQQKRNNEYIEAMRVTPAVISHILTWLIYEYDLIMQANQFKLYKQQTKFDSQDIQAQFNLAECYQYGKGIKIDWQKAHIGYMLVTNNEDKTKEIVKRSYERIGDYFYYKRQMYRAALEYYLEFITPYSCSMIAKIYEEKGKTDKASEWHKKAEEMLRDGKDKIIKCVTDKSLIDPKFSYTNENKHQLNTVQQKSKEIGHEEVLNSLKLSKFQ